ncbi:hypothetical protein [Lacisediminihabitans sp.]|uniref:hypothetical protein n=1 Tax=Lacisediminihabitans sp. TaxID=2787631 RepID=UPI00374D1D86
MRTFGSLTRAGRLSLVAGLTVFLVLAGTGVATAAWTSAASVTGSVTAATTSLTIAGAPSLSTTYAFAGTASQSPNIVRTMVVANTGTAPLTYSLFVSGVAGNALAPLVTLTLWTTAATCSTTAGSGATTGTIAAPPTLPTGALSAAPGATYTLCASTSLNSTIAASQGLSVTPTLTITGTAGGSWSASASDATFTQSVYQINPVSPTCLRSGNVVTLSWIAPPNTSISSAVTYRVVDAFDNTIVIKPYQTGLSVQLVSGDVSGSSGSLVLQAREAEYGTSVASAPVTVYVKGVLRCP